MKISVLPLPDAVSERVQGMGRTLDVYLDGVLQRRVQTADDERGYVDRFTGTHMRDGGDGTHYELVQRIFGKVELKWSHR